jgi:SM-20-related protein
MHGDIVVVDNFLPAGDFENLARFVANEPMNYGSRSNMRTDPHGHWMKNFVSASRLNLADVSRDLDKVETAPLQAAWNFLRSTRLENELLIRCYLNGYTYGTDGYFHADSDRTGEHTTILYMNDYWEPDWAGETVFLGPDGDIVQSVLPRTNRAVIFPAEMQHAGRSVSRKCMVLRKTLIFKSREQRSANFEKLSAFLRSAGATEYAHKSGMLHEHLVRTFSLLEAKGFPSTVCFGGGLHAIYGTNAFRPQTLTAGATAWVAEEFGPYAGELARLFSDLERPKTLETPLELNAGSALVLARDGRKLTLPRETFDDLRKMECANLIDQNALAKHKALSEFWKNC